MRLTSGLSRRIVAVGRPSLARRLQPDIVRAFDLLVFLLPIVALIVRLESGPGLAAIPAFLVLVSAAVLAATAFALIRVLAGRGDPLLAARELDRMGDSAELFVTAAELEPRRPDSPLFPLLLARAEAALAGLRGRRPRPRFLLPALRRDLVFLLLTFLVLIAPALPSGWLGPRTRPGVEKGSGERGQGAPGTTAEERARSAGEAAYGLAGRLEVRAVSDRALYFLGEEIELILVFEAREPLGDRAVEVVLLIDGEVEMALPLPDDFALPGEAGATSEARFRLRERLKLVDRYRRGLLALDARVRPEDDEDPDAAVAANRVLVQIAENSERVQARRPTPLAEDPKKQKPKKDEKPEKDRDQDQKPNENNDPERRPKPVPSRGEGDLPPEDLPAKDYVVEPLFSGDETSKRKVNVYDRNLEDAAPERENPGRGDPPRRRYERMVEAEMRKLGLGGRERRAVRRYLDALQPGADGKDR